MYQPDSGEATLESVVARLAPEYAERVLSLTILFHPDVSRIGEAWEYPIGDRSPNLVIGRYRPRFAAEPGRAGAPLGEAHISRRALRLRQRGDSLELRKLPGACRCKVAGRELADRVGLDSALLAGGVALQLGNAAVLWLRTGPPRRPDTLAAASALVGRGPAMRRLRREVARAAATDLDVLVMGETGVGKELTASDLHRSSARAGGPLVAVNMSAIPATLAPSILFGSARGAYTGATRPAPGYFQQADRGTLFLDEIGETPRDIQPQLLRALQQREIQVVGGDLQSVDIRVVAATDARLSGSGSDFNPALRHRLGSIEIRVPPLREHLEDLGELLLHFLGESAAAMACEHLLPGEEGDDLLTATWAEVFQLFACHSWPGNIRELANTARQLLVASEERLVLPAAILQRLHAQVEYLHAPMERLHAAIDSTGTGGNDGESRVAPGGISRSMKEVGVEEFRRTFAGSSHEVAATARALGVSRQAVYRRIEEHPDLRLAADVPETELQAALEAAGGDVRTAARALSVSEQGLRARLRARRWRE